MASSPLARLRSRLRGRGGAVVEPTVEPAPEHTPGPEWEYVPEGWARLEADPRIKGWDVEAIAAAHRATWPSYRQAIEGPGPLGIYHEVPVGEEVKRDVPIQQNVIMSFAYVLALAARLADRISVLDWGGGIGHYYPLSQGLLPGIEIDYHIKDVPALCAAGRVLFPEVHFYEDDSCLRSRYDLVFASNSLQFSAAWEKTFSGLAAAAGRYLFVTRLPVSVHGPSFVVLQRAYGYGYDTEFLGWVFGRDELLEAAAQAGMSFLREFVFHSWPIPGAPANPVELRGYLFAPQGERARP
jgi:putative methyltransferase (TIGR04325 family)